LFCNQKLLAIEGPKGLITYPLYSEFDYSKTEKKLYIAKAFNTHKKKAFFRMYQLLLTQAALGVLLGYRRQLNIVGIGYQVSIEKKRFI